MPSPVPVLITKASQHCMKGGLDAAHYIPACLEGEQGTGKWLNACIFCLRSQRTPQLRALSKHWAGAVRPQAPGTASGVAGCLWAALTRHPCGGQDNLCPSLPDRRWPLCRHHRAQGKPRPTPRAALRLLSTTGFGCWGEDTAQSRGWRAGGDGEQPHSIP